MSNYILVRDKNGCITAKVPVSASVIIYKNEVLKFLDELHKCSKYNKPFRTFKQFQFDWIVKQRNERKQRQIMKHKKIQAKW